MKLENHCTIDAPASEVWTTMLDFERVAGCVPGSQVIGPAEGGGLEANIRVKVGAMAMTYWGVVAIVEQDENLGRAVMQAKAREAAARAPRTHAWSWRFMTELPSACLSPPTSTCRVGSRRWAEA